MGSRGHGLQLLLATSQVSEPHKLALGLHKGAQCFLVFYHCGSDRKAERVGRGGIYKEKLLEGLDAGAGSGVRGSTGRGLMSPSSEPPQHRKQINNAAASFWEQLVSVGASSVVTH